MTGAAPTPKRVGLWIAVGAVVIGAVAAAIALRGDGAPGDVAVDQEPSKPAGPSDRRGAPSSTDSGDRPAARDERDPARLLASARQDAAAGRYREAAALFQRAYELDPDPATLFEVGRMAHLTGRCRDAQRALQRVMAASPGAELAGKAQQLLDEIGRCD